MDSRRSIYIYIYIDIYIERYMFELKREGRIHKEEAAHLFERIVIIVESERERERERETEGERQDLRQELE